MVPSLTKRVLTFLAYALLALLLPCAESGLGAQGRLPPVVVPGGWAKVDQSLPDLGEYEQPVIYESWWLEIGSCEGRIVPLDLTRRVHFVYVNSPTMIVDLDPGVYGFASGETITIYLALPEIWHKSVVMHEMMHLLDYWNGIDEGRDYHPMPQFERCGIHHFWQP